MYTMFASVILILAAPAATRAPVNKAQVSTIACFDISIPRVGKQSGSLPSSVGVHVPDVQIPAPHAVFLFPDNQVPRRDALAVRECQCGASDLVSGIAGGLQILSG